MLWSVEIYDSLTYIQAMFLRITWEGYETDRQYTDIQANSHDRLILIWASMILRSLSCQLTSPLKGRITILLQCVEACLFMGVLLPSPSHETSGTFHCCSSLTQSHDGHPEKGRGLLPHIAYPFEYDPY